MKTSAAMARAEKTATGMRTRDPEATRRRVLAAATSEFARSGFGGARVDAIARRARANKQLIYHYFGSKQKLFLSVLEDAYGHIREAENHLELDHLEPVTALTTLVTFTWNYYLDRPEFLALVTDENLHRARHLKSSRVIRDMHVPFRSRLSHILERGVREKRFRRGIDADQLNLTIAAIGYYYLNNRFTNSVIYETDLFAPEALDRRLAFNIDTILRTVLLHNSGRTSGRSRASKGRSGR
jgi:AcrR family transcriptional regulator